MKTRLLMFLTLLAICPGCASLSEQARRNNIRVVTHPNLVNGMDFVTGYTSQAGYMWGPAEIGNMAANSAAKAGYRDVFVLVELVEPGETGGEYSYGRLAMWRTSIYRSAMESRDMSSQSPTETQADGSGRKIVGYRAVRGKTDAKGNPVLVPVFEDEPKK